MALPNRFLRKKLGGHAATMDNKKDREDDGWCWFFFWRWTTRVKGNVDDDEYNEEEELSNPNTSVNPYGPAKSIQKKAGRTCSNDGQQEGQEKMMDGVGFSFGGGPQE